MKLDFKMSQTLRIWQQVILVMLMQNQAYAEIFICFFLLLSFLTQSNYAVFQLSLNFCSELKGQVKI